MELRIEPLGRVLPVAPGENLLEVLRAHLNQKPRALKEIKAEIPTLQEQVVLKMLAKEPIARYQSTFDVLQALGIEVDEGMGASLLTSAFVGRQAELGKLVEALGAVKSAASSPNGIRKGQTFYRCALVRVLWWCGVVWCGVVWCGVVCCGVVCACGGVNVFLLCRVAANEEQGGCDPCVCRPSNHPPHPHPHSLPRTLPSTTTTTTTKPSIQQQQRRQRQRRCLVS